MSWHGDENGSFQLRAGGADCDSGTVLDSGAYGSQPAVHVSDASAAQLSEGANTLRLCLSDAAGNRGAATTTLTRDTAAPETQITDQPPALAKTATAKFEFSGEDPGGSGVASFQCRLDSSEAAAWGTCSSPQSYTSPPDGAHKFEVRAIDNAGNADATPASFEWTVDTVAPGTALDSSPTALANSTTAKFDFSGEDPGGSGVAGFQCRQDSTEADAWQPCTSPIKYFSLAEGSHSFEVRAIDHAGNSDQSPATYTWSIDSKAPDTQITTKPAALVKTATAKFEFSGSDPGGSGLASFQCRLDSEDPEAWAPCSSPQEYAGLSEGSHKFEVRAIDNAGNADASPASYEWTVDTVAPQPAIDALSKALLKAGETSEVSWHGDENGSFQLRAGGADCDSGTVLDSGAYGSQPAVHVSDASAAQLSEGANTLRLCLSDAAGNRGAATTTLTRDTAAPETQITAKPTALANTAAAEFEFTGEDPGGSGVAGFQCRLDSSEAAAWGTCSSPQEYAGLSEGSHKFEVRAIDNAGNADASAATFEWTVDTVAPQPAIDALSKALLKAGETSEVSWHGDENGSFQLRAGGADCDSGTVLDSGAYGSQPAVHVSDVSAAQLSEGANTLRLCLSDAAGNRGAATTTLTRDTAAPETQITDQPPALAKTATAKFEFSGEDPGGSGVASFQCRLDSGEAAAWAACTSPKQYSALAEGPHSFEVRAIDQAGNADQSAAAFAWSVDTTPPAVGIDSGPAGLTNDPTPTFGFSSEPGAAFECSIDTGTPAFGPCSGAGAHTPAAPLADGPHSFRVRATDQAGNQATATRDFAVDATVPETQITAKPAALASSAAAEFEFAGEDAGGSGIASFQCRLDSSQAADWAACASPRQYSALAEGPHSFEVKAIDQAGNADPSLATYEWTVDTVAPSTTIDSSPPALANTAAASFAFSGADPGGSGIASFQCRLDSSEAAAWAACASPRQYSALADGVHTFEVRAVDQAGNADPTPASFGWSVDTTAPQTQITAKPTALANTATAKFEFTGEDPGGSGVAGFQCRLDSSEAAAWGTCSSPQEYAGLSEGSHKFEARAIDNAGNADQSPASFEWTIDTTPPAVQVDSGPAGLTNDPTPTFGFSSEPGASFECSIDTGTPAFGPCSGAGAHTPAAPLADGPHSFRVRATDQAGNQATATRDFAVDATVPETQITAKPAALASSAAAEFEFAGEDAGGSGIASFQCRLDSSQAADWAACASPRQYSALAEGPHSFEVRAIDQAGNADPSPATYEWTVDTEAPDTQITDQPAALANTASAKFEFSGSDPGGSGLASFQCRLDSSQAADWAACTSPKQYSALAEGPHSFEVRAIDQAGNTDPSPASFSWTIDTTPPAVGIDSGPAGLTNDPTPTFGFSSEPGASFECSIDTGTPAFGPCSGAGAHTPAAPLADGPHSFRVRATDQAGNRATATRGFAVDATVPETQITAKPAALANSAAAEFEFAGEDAGGSGVAAFECRLDSAAPGAWTSCASPRQYSALAEGPHSFEVKAIDQAGNADPSLATYEWTVDTVAPSTTLDSSPPALANTAGAKFEFSGEDGSGSGIEGFQCRKDSGSWGTCTSPTEYTSLPDGAHTFEVRAIDKAGNADQSAAAFAWSVDTTPPAVGIDSGPAGLTNDPTPTFGFSSEPGASFECSIDTGTPAFGPCSGAGAHTPAAPLADGPHSFRVRATDQAGNQATATRDFAVDATVPETQITAKPAALANSAAAEFEFAGEDPGGSGVASLECRLDSTEAAAWASCSSPKEYAELAEGSHSFEVRAVDQAGNADPTPASFGWSVDTTAPDTQITDQPAALANTAAASFAFSGADPGGSGIASFQCRLDSSQAADWAACASPQQYSALAEGPHSFEVRAIDVAGNVEPTPASYAWSIDTIAPQTQITAKPTALANTATAKFEFSGEDPGGSGVAAFECRLDSSQAADWAACASPRQYSALAEGPHSFEVKAIDQAGNTDPSPASFSWSIDTAGANTTITTHPLALSSSAAAKFEFAGEDPGGSGVASFECRRDAEDWTPCTSPRSYSELAEGAHSFEVRAIDQAGNADQSAAAFAWSVDTTPPAVGIDSGPAGLTNDPTPTFGFSSEPGASFECSIDTGTPAFGPCSGAGAHTPAAPLADGPHSFRVRATDQAGNQATATRDFAVDATVPETQITAKPAALANSAAAEFEFAGEDPGGSGVASLECRLDSTEAAAWASCSSPKEYAELAEGSHSFEVRAVDQAGNADPTPASFGWSVDTTAPDIQITDQPAALANTAAASFAFSGADPGGSGIASFQCRLDSSQAADWATCASPRQYSALAEGPHSFEVRAIDQAGNADPSPATYEWTVDTEAPDTQITDQPAALANTASAKFEFSGSDPGGSGLASFQCRLDSGEAAAWAACSSPQSYTSLPDGAHTFEVRAIDQAGNVDPSLATYEWTVDTVAPGTALDSSPTALANTASAKFEFAGEDPGGSGVASLECRLDSTEAAAWASCSSPKEYAELAEGNHSFEVRAVDQAGNADASPATYTWSIDTKAPDTQITAKPAALVNTATAKFEFSGEDPGGSGLAAFQCRLDSSQAADWAACASPKAYSGLADGAHTFEVRAIDQAGNADPSPAAYEWSVDTVAPQPAIDALSKALLKAGETSEVSWHGDENGSFQLRAGGADCDSGTVLDSGAYGSQPAVHVSDASAAQLSEGANTLRLCLSDAAGNRGAATATLTRDTAAPSTTIDSSPPALASTASAKFEFSGADPGGSGLASFQCRLDSSEAAAWGTCSSPQSYTSLPDGAHKFEARAIDNAGNADQSPASFEWTIDTTPPAVQVDSGPAGLTNDPTPTFGFSSEPGASFECSIDTGTPAFGPCSGAGAHTPAAPLADGPHSFRVRATDQAGNQATATRGFAVDTAAPAAPVLSATEPASPANENNPKILGSAPAGTTVKLYTNADCTGSPLATGTAAELEAGIAVSVADDSTTDFRATSTTTAENTSGCSEPLTYVEDLSAPETQIETKPAALTNSAAADFAFSGSDPSGSGIASFECRRDGGAWAPCTSPQQYAGLAEGAHSFEVKATDQAGNTDPSPASFSWTIDLTAPQVTIDSLSKALLKAGETSEATWHADENGAFELRVGGADCSAGTVIDSGNYADQPAPHLSNVTAAQLQEGANTLRLCLGDAAGNRGSATTTLSRDTAAPSTTIDSSPPALASTASAKFEFSGSDPGGSGVAAFECRLDSSQAADWTSCASPQQYAGLAEGAHSFEVKATDQAGNTDASPATYTWSIDTKAPDTQITAKPAALVNTATAKFEFSGADPGGSGLGSLQCRRDAEDWTSCTSPRSYSALAEGPHDFEVRAIDIAGNADPTPAVFNWTIDSKAPDTAIETKPAALTSSATADFAFSGDDGAGSGIASFECRRDGGAWAPCTSPQQYSALAEGAHSFEVRAIDQAGNADPSAAAFAWTVDTTAPVTQIDSGPAALSASATAKFEFSGEDPGGSGLAAFQCRLDSSQAADWTSCASPKAYAGLAEGAHSFEVRAIDVAGNVEPTPASYAWSIDTIAPQTQITANPTALANTATAKFEFSGEDPGGSGLAAFQCRLDSSQAADWTSCASPKAYAGLAEGAHSFEVKAIDQAGNTDPSPASFGWTIDTTPPAVGIDSGPAGLTNDPTPTFEFSSEPGASFECSIDTGTPAFGPCSGAGAHTPAAPLADGPHSFRVRATDQAGNQATATRDFAVDTAAPPAPELSATVPASPANDNNPKILGSAPAGTTVKLYTNADCTGSPLATGTAAELEAGIAVSVADDSTTDFRATSTTAAENTSGCSEPLTYVEDSSAPETQIETKPAALTSSATADFAFSGDDGAGSGIASFECRRDGGAWAPCTSPQQYAGLAEGAHSFEVKATDQAGNTDASPATYTWSIDTKAPDTQITAKPVALVNTATAKFEFSGADPGGSGLGSLQCRRDAEDWTPCSSPRTYGGLSDGPHSFEVRAIDQAGNADPSPAAYEWTIDTGVPQTQITAKPSTLANTATAKFEFSGEDPGGSGLAAFQCRLDSSQAADWAACASPKAYSGLADGAHTFEVRAIDQAGNADPSPAAYEWSVDTVAPQPAIDALSKALLKAGETSEVSWHGDENGSFQLRAGGADCDSGTVLDSGAYGSQPAVHVSDASAAQLSEGANTLRLCLSDAAGNRGAATATLTRDTAAPSTTIDSSPPALASTASAKFEFSGADPGGSGLASFQCRLDSSEAAAWGTCSSPQSYTSLPDGAHKFEARAIDNAGNADQSPASFEWTIDTTPPAVQVDSGPAGLTNDPTPTFGFSSEPGASFECSIDTGTPAFGPCSGAGAHTPAAPLADGPHSFRVRATDQAGNQATATRGFAVDTAAPAAPVLSATEPASPANENNPKILGSAPAGTTVKLYTNADCTGSPLATGTAAELEAGIAVSVADDSTTDFRATSTTTAENTSGCSEPLTYVEDSSAPETQIETKPAALTNSAAADFAFSGSDPSGSGIASFECRRDGGAWAPCTSPQQYAGLAEGAHSFEVKATDQAGNTDPSPASFSWTIDLTAPQVTIDSLSKALLKAGETSEATWHADENGAFELRVGGADCSAGTVIDSGNYADQPAPHLSNVTAAQLQEGANTLRLCLGDAAGNRGSATTTLSRDTAAPSTTIDSSPPALASTASAKFEFSGSDPGGSGVAAFECRLDSSQAADWTSCASPKAYSGLADGAHTFEVRAIDQAGNADPSAAAFAWSVDTTPPAVGIDSGPAGLTNDPTPTFGFSSEPGASFECSIDTGTPAFGPCSGAGAHTPAAPLADGPHSFRVRATDQAGNRATATRGFAVDTAAPAAPVLSATVPASPAHENNPQILGSAPAGTTVKLYTNADCTGSPLATGTAAGLQAGIAVSVADDSTTDFRATSTTAAENTSGCSEPLTYVEDSSAPETQIDSKPAALANTAAAEFDFSGEDPGGSGVASFECRRDAEAWAPCTSPQQYSGLSEGAHTFEVKATDQAGNTDPSPASFSWSIDTAGANTTITTHPLALSSSAAAKFEFAGEDPGGSGVASFECRRDAEDWTPCTSPREYAALAEGAHSFEVKAIDQAGNADPTPASFNWTIDTTPPAVQVDSGPAGLTNDPTPTFAFSSEPGASFECSIDTGTPAFGPCSDPTSDTPSSPLPDGPHSFRVRATDQAGNRATATRDFEVDTASPQPPVLSATEPASPANENNPKILGSAPAGTTVKLYTNADCTGSPLATGTAAGLQAGIAVSVADDSTTDFRATSTTAADNTSGCSEPLAYREDSSAPTTTLDSHPAALVNVATAEFAFSGADPGGSGLAALECRLDGGSWAACSSPKQYTGLADGSHTFEVRAIDKAGNADQSPASHAWSVDTTPPAVGIDSGPAGLTNDPTPTFGFSSEPGAAFECSIDTGTPAFGPCSGAGAHTPAPPLSDGPHSFRVRATDQAGNQATATRDFAVDTASPQPPELTATVPASPASDNNPKLVGSAPAGTTVRLYESAECSGAPVATATAAGLQAGIAVTVADDSLSSFSATATTTAGNASGCSEPLAYREDSSAPQTLLGAHPAALSASAAAAFEFSGSDPGGSGVSSFQCRLDSGQAADWASCASPKAYAELSDGAHQFEVRAIDAAGNDATPASFAWSIDTTAPATQIDTHPVAIAATATAKFEFTGEDPGGSGLASFQCRRDSSEAADWEPCTSPRTYTALAEGAHSFEVRAIDQAGNADPTPASFNWTIDTKAPQTLLGAHPAALSGSAAASFEFSGEDPGGSGLASFQCRRDSSNPADWQTCASPKQYSSLTDGAHQFEVRAIDAAGNADATPASFAWSIDTTAPATQIDTHPAALSASATASFSFSGADGGSGLASFQCRRDSTSPADWQSCASPKEYAALSDGAHSFEVRAIDQAGNADASPASFSWSIDTTPPAVGIDSGPTGLSNDATPTFDFHPGEAGASVECSIDQGTPAFGPCSGPSSHTPPGPLADGPHTFRLRATDAAGNQATATRSFSVDTSAPQAPQLSATVPASPANQNNPKLVGSAPATTTVKLYSGAGCAGSPIATASAAQLESGIVVSVPDDSSTAFSATATTAAENSSGCSEPITYTEDSSAPTTQITTHPAALASSEEAKFEFSGADPGGSGLASFECRLDAGSWAPCTSPQQYTGLADGSHSFEVRAIDKAGNADPSPASHAWSVDTTPPAVGIDSGPAGLTNDPTPTFGFSSEPGASFECSIDTGTPAFGPCSDPTSDTPSSPLPDGPHSFRVRATDQAGNRATATRDFEVDTASPQPPVLSATEPASPANENNPKILGSAPAGTTVRLYPSAECSGAPLATVSASALQAGISVAVADDTLSSFSATATTTAGNTSGCSEPLAYREDSKVPQTTIDTHPAALVNVATAEFAFSGSDGEGSGLASFQCRLDGGSWAPCTSPQTYTSLPEGAHTFEVRAIDKAGNADPSPASHAWSVDTTPPEQPAQANTESSPVPTAPKEPVSADLAQLVRVMHNTKNGTALLVFRVFGPGLLEARASKVPLPRAKSSNGQTAAGIRRKKLRQRRIEPKSIRVARAGQVKVPISLTAAGKSLLRKNHRLKVKVVIRFRSTQAPATTWKININLKQSAPSLTSSTRHKKNR